MSESSKALSRRFTELFSTDDLSLADDVLAEDVVFHGAVPGGLRGIDAVKGFLAAFPDAVSTVEDQVAEGDTVVTRWRARHPRRAARRPARDELGLLRRLGAIPEPQPAGAA